MDTRNHICADCSARFFHASELADHKRTGHMKRAPECPYCGATEGLRVKCDGGVFLAPEYTCEACFKGQDDGPCFDDLPLAAAPKIAGA